MDRTFAVTYLESNAETENCTFVFIRDKEGRSGLRAHVHVGYTYDLYSFIDFVSPHLISPIRSR